MTILEQAQGAASDSQKKALLRSALVRAIIAFGESERAGRVLAESDELANRARKDERWVWVQNHQTLTRARFALTMGRDSAVLGTLEKLARSMIRRRQVDDEALDVVVECGDWLCQIGLFRQGRAMLNHARDLSRDLAHVSARLQSAMSLLAAHCAQETRDNFDLEHHWLNEALALSSSNGSVAGTLGALSGLVQYYVSAGCDDGAYVLACEGLALAQATEGTYLLQGFALQIAGALLRTRHWRVIAPLVFDLDRFVPFESLRWSLLKEFQGMYLVRINEYERASQALSQAYNVAVRFGNRWLEGMALRDLAVARYGSGLLDEATELMRHAIDIVEGHGSAISLCATYDAASRILRDHHIVRVARRLRAGFSTRAHNIGARLSIPPYQGDLRPNTPSLSRSGGVRPLSLVSIPR